jgi:hypothetical protein
MGQLKPGVRYIYERQGGVVYAREAGAPASQRQEIGWDWEISTNPAVVKGASIDTIRENQLWYKIREASMSNLALQEAIERVKVLYYLSQKENGNSET